MIGLQRAVNALLFCSIYASANAQSTTVVSLTSTTTIHATASDAGAACSNFEGSCVVYGDNGAEGASYTTTASRESTPTTTGLVTSTTIIPASTTVTDADACRDYRGACVVYVGNGAAAYTTTAAGYSGGQAAGQQALGNSDGYIAMNGGNSAAVMGAGSSLPAWTWTATMCVGAAMTVWWT